MCNFLFYCSHHLITWTIALSNIGMHCSNKVITVLISCILKKHMEQFDVNRFHPNDGGITCSFS